MQDAEFKKKQMDIAVALRYQKAEDAAPKVIASGRGLIAKKIVESAEENDVPIQNNPEVASILSELEIGQEIPPELYGVIAEVLAFVYSIEKKCTSSK